MIERLRPSAPVVFVDSNDARQMARYPAMNARGQMYVLDPAGELSGGYDALAALAPVIPAFAWMSRFFKAPPVRAIGRRAYAWIAANRYRLGGQAPCDEGACALNPH
jgi:predicted DCC family thiol-disulfide oxidoreductase YuxK